MRRPPRVLPLALLALLLAPSGGRPFAGESGPARPGTVHFSDGESVEGELLLTPGQPLRLHLGTTVRELPLASLTALQFRPVLEELRQRWRFPEAGKTRKEKWGPPYPVRELEASVRLGGETLTGHLYTTVLYLRDAEGTRKVILKAKQKGEPGQRLADLVYVTRIHFADAPEETAGARIRIPPALRDAPVRLVGLTRPGLARTAGEARGEGAVRVFPLQEREALILGLALPDRLVVEWPEAEQDFALAEHLDAALASDVKDFFDERRLLAARLDAYSPHVYTLLLLRRRGKTTLPGKADRPWRLAVWRWLWDAENQQLQLAGRGWLFRGILPPGDEPPEIRLVPSLTRQATDGAPVLHPPMEMTP